MFKSVSTRAPSMPSHRFQWNFASLKDLPQKSKKDKKVSILVFSGGR